MFDFYVFFASLTCVYIYVCMYVCACRRKFRRQTSDNMDQIEKQRWEEKEKRKEEERRSEKRTSQKKEDAGARR